MSGWVKGDLALCVGGHNWQPDNCAMPTDGLLPKRGGVYVVEEVYPWMGATYLIFSDFGYRGFEQSAFRKIDPLTDAERRQALADLGERVGERVL